MNLIPKTIFYFHPCSKRSSYVRQSVKNTIEITPISHNYKNFKIQAFKSDFGIKLELLSLESDNLFDFLILQKFLNIFGKLITKIISRKKLKLKTLVKKSKFYPNVIVLLKFQKFYLYYVFDEWNIFLKSLILP